MNVERQLLTLGVVIAAGLLGQKIIARVRRSGGLAEVDGTHQAVLDSDGHYIRCEEYVVAGGFREVVRVVPDSNCKGCGGFAGILGCPS